MTEPSLPGVCPNCDLEGEVGTPCPERGCAKRGYHVIPREYATWSESKGPHPMVGRVIGRYLAVKVLAAGGFGTVHLALQLAMLSKRAAVKVLHPQDDPAMLELFLRKFRAEAEALAVVSHPNVVQLLDYGTQDDEPYMVMEFVEGARTLADELHERLRHGRGFSPDEIRSLLEQTANGLDAAHAKGITHRDVKPENLMIQPVAGNPLLVRIVDFGLARFEEQGTRTSKAMGTPTYMAPEQLHLQEVGPWTDMYALGVVAYELLTGRLPFPGRTVQEIIAKKINPTYEPLSDLKDLHLAPVVEGFLRRALARDARNRYRSATQFKAGLLEACTALESGDRPTAGGPGQELRRRIEHDQRQRENETLRAGEGPLLRDADRAAAEPKREPLDSARREFVDAPRMASPPPVAERRPAEPTRPPPLRGAARPTDFVGPREPAPARARPTSAAARFRAAPTPHPARAWIVYGGAAVSLTLTGLLLGLWLTGRAAPTPPDPPAALPAATTPAATPTAAPTAAPTPAAPTESAPASAPPPAPAPAATCEPDCEGRSCGDDGCGGTCGTCKPGQPCRDGQCCVCTSGPCCDGCNYATSTPACWEHLKGLKSPVTSY